LAFEVPHFIILNSEPQIISADVDAITKVIGSQLTTRYWLLGAILTVQFVPHRKHTPSP
jgi:hypothetical protein